MESLQSAHIKLMQKNHTPYSKQGQGLTPQNQNNYKTEISDTPRNNFNSRGINSNPSKSNYAINSNKKMFNVSGKEIWDAVPVFNLQSSSQNARQEVKNYFNRSDTKLTKLATTSNIISFNNNSDTKFFNIRNNMNNNNKFSMSNYQPNFDSI